MKGSTNQQDTEYTQTEIVLPKNSKTSNEYFRYDVESESLPSISVNLAEIVSMLNNQVATQEKIVTLLTSQAASLNTHDENQAQITSLILDIAGKLGTLRIKHGQMEKLVLDMMVSTMTVDPVLVDPLVDRIEQEGTVETTTLALNEETTASSRLETTQTTYQQQESTTVPSADTG